LRIGLEDEWVIGRVIEGRVTGGRVRGGREKVTFASMAFF